MAFNELFGLSIRKDIKIPDVLGCIGSVIFLLFVSNWLPFIGPFFSLLLPLPFLFYTSKLGVRRGLITVLITLLAISVIVRLAGYPQIIIICLEFAIVGLVISEIFRRELSFALTVFWGTLIMLLIGGIFLFVIGLTKGMGPIELILNYFVSNLNKTIGFYENMGLEPDKVAQLKEYGKIISHVISQVYPAMLVIGTSFVIWLNVVVSRFIFRLGGIKYPDLGQIDRWQAPEFFVWVVIAAGFALFFKVTGLKFIAINVLIVLSVIYTFHGLSIVIFFFNKYKVPVWIRYGAYILIIVQQLFLIILALAGLFDNWIDFRKIHKKTVD